HPPLRVACSRRETIHLAATKGIGALSFSFIEPAEAKAWVDNYYATLASDECVPGGFAVNPNVAVVLPMMCHADEQTAIERGLDGAHFFGFSLGHYYVFGTHRPGRTVVWDEFEEKRDLFGFRRQTAAQTGQTLGAQLFETGPGPRRGRRGSCSASGGSPRRRPARRWAPRSSSRPWARCGGPSARPTRCGSSCAATRTPGST